MLAQTTISNLLRPLVILGLYKNEEAALKDVIANYMKRKIEDYNGVIKKMEDRHGKNFSSFTKEIKNKASMEIEDDWMEWKAAISMMDSWKKAFKGLLGNAP